MAQLLAPTCLSGVLEIDNCYSPFKISNLDPFKLAIFSYIRKGGWGSASLFPLDLVFSDHFSQSWLGSFSNPFSYFMSQYFKFAPKEHNDLLRLPNLDIYCHLSKMIINFSETTLLFLCVLISSISHQDWWLGDSAQGGPPWPLPALHCHINTSRSRAVTAQPLAIVELADPYVTQCYLSKLNAASSGQGFKHNFPLFTESFLSIPSLNQKVVHA